MSEFLDPQQEIQKHGSKLPHWQQMGAMQFVTFRLADALPADKLHEWKEAYQIWSKFHPKPWNASEEKEYQKRFVWQIEHWLDGGSGSCLLAQPTLRAHLEDTLLHDEGARVEHHAWVIMPNHVHLLFTAQDRLEHVMKSWKGISARKMGQGSIWQKGYRDTMIRDSRHFANAVRYIRRNPVSLQPGTFALWQSERALGISTSKS